MKNNDDFFKEMADQVDSTFEQMEEVCSGLGMRENVQNLAANRKKLQNRRFVIGFLGEFKRGRSTIINMLLGKEILPADILPCTAVTTRVIYGAEPQAELIMKDSSTRWISVEELSEHITHLTSDSEAQAAQVKEAVVYYPSDFCRNSVEIVDIPGLNDTEQKNSVSESIIQTLDAIIMVLGAGSPFSVSEAAFICNKITINNLSRLIIVVNMIDIVRKESDRQLVIENCRHRVHDAILERIADVYGKGSQRYQNARRNLIGIRFIPLSAQNALYGMMYGDQDLVRCSGVAELQETLTHILTTERCTLELGRHINLLWYTASEVEGIIWSRKGAMTMALEDVERIEEAAQQQIRQLRNKKEHERSRLNLRAKEVEIELVCRAGQFYSELERYMADVVERWAGPYSVPGNQQHKFLMDNVFSVFTQRTMAELQEIICLETMEEVSFVDAVSCEISEICEELSGQPRKTYRAICENGFSLLPTEHDLMRSIHPCPIRGPLFFGAVDAIGPVMIAHHPMEFRRIIKARIFRTIRELQERRVLENWVEKLVKESFNALSAAMDKICEGMLIDYQSALEEILHNTIRSAEERRALGNQLSNVQHAFDAVIKDLGSVCDMIRSDL